MYNGIFFENFNVFKKFVTIIYNWAIFWVLFFYKIRSVIKGCIMAVQNVNNYQVNPYQMQQGFQMPVNNQSPYGELIDLKEHPDCFEYVYEKSASPGRKVGVGIASALFPGLGQMINGQWGKGAAFMGSNLLMVVMLLTNAKGGVKRELIISTANFVLNLISIVDAVRNVKQKETVIVPKQQANYPLG